MLFSRYLFLQKSSIADVRLGSKQVSHFLKGKSFYKRVVRQLAEIENKKNLIANVKV